MNGLCVRKGQHTRHGHERGTKSGSGAYVTVARFRFVSCRAMSEPLREKIKFALRLQPGETAAALDGDAHSIRPLAFFARKVAPEWLDSMMHAELYCEHPSAEESAPLKGINMLRFHEWAASLVSTVDPSFDRGAHHQSRSKNARAIHAALAEWASKKPKVEDADEVIEINV